MYLNEEGKEVPNPDPKSGLYVKARNGSIVKVDIPSDCIAFQIGETACIHSGGILQATPHCVKAPKGIEAKGISRESMAVFMGPMPEESMTLPKGADKDLVLNASSPKYLPEGVPYLHTRWDESMNYAQFSEKTFASYY